MKYIGREGILKVFTHYYWEQQHMASIFVWILLQLFQRTQNRSSSGFDTHNDVFGLVSTL
jgi:hypothetical protein